LHRPHFPKTDFDETSINPRMALKYELSPAGHLRLLPIGIRAPYGFSEVFIYAGFATVWKSSDLDPEKIGQYNLSPITMEKRIRLSANLFRTNLKDKMVLPMPTSRSLHWVRLSMAKY
jgi:outer membrane receptor for ferrienterochelin and colicins